MKKHTKIFPSVLTNDSMTIVELTYTYTNGQNIINGLTVWGTTISNLEADISHLTDYTSFARTGFAKIFCY